MCIGLRFAFQLRQCAERVRKIPCIQNRTFLPTRQHLARLQNQRMRKDRHDFFHMMRDEHQRGRVPL